MSHLISRILISIVFGIAIWSCNYLEKGQLAKIKYESIGCFESYQNTIIIIEKGNNLFAELHSLDRVKTVPIEAADRLRFDNIILELRDLKESGGCTNSLKYSVYTNEGTFVRKDNACQDVGLNIFVQEIFGNSN